MSEPFDPYHRWLGIPPKEQPPHHYRLFGLEPFESDREVIDSVATRHMTFLQDITGGPHVRDAQRLLNELAAARRCLLDPAKKAAYDAALRRKLEAAEHPSAARGHGAPPNAQAAIEKPARRGARGRVGRRRQSPSGSQARRYRIAAGWAAAVALIAVAILLAIGRGPRSDRNARSGPVPRVANFAAPVAVSAQHLPDERTRRPARLNSAAQPPADADRLPDLPLPPSDAEPTDSAAAHGPPPSSASGAADAEPASRVEPQESSSVAATEAEPVDVQGLLAWLDAGDPTTIDADPEDGVSKWRDRSGNENHAQTETDRGPSCVPDVLAGRPVIRFTGGQCLHIKGSSEWFRAGRGFTLFSVASGSVGTLLSKGSGASDGSFAMSAGAGSFRAGGRELEAGEQPASAFRVRTVLADGRSLRWFVDGRPARSYADYSAAITSRNAVRIGAGPVRGKGLQEFFDGDVAELLVYELPLDTGRRQAVESYLLDKWLADKPSPASPSESVVPAAAATAPENSAEPPAVGDPAEPAVTDDQPRPAASKPARAAREKPEKVTLYVNLGGPTCQGADGTTWLGSKPFDGETFGHEAGRAVREETVADPIAATAQRGLRAFRAIVPNGEYSVVLCFSEHWTSDPTLRMFGVSVEQRPVRAFGAPGMGRLFSYVVPRVKVGDGRLDVEFQPLNSKASSLLNGIVIRQIR